MQMATLDPSMGFLRGICAGLLAAKGLRLQRVPDSCLNKVKKNEIS